LNKGLKKHASSLRNERNRFAALAFVWGDLLLELDEAFEIVFASGASEGILGLSNGQIEGIRFVDLLSSNFRPLVSEMLHVARRRGRMDNVLVRFTRPDERISPPVSMTGYFLPDLGGHFFVALRVTVNSLPHDVLQSIKRDGPTGLLDEESLSRVVTERLMAQRETGQNQKFSLFTLNAFEPLCERMEHVARDEMLATIGSFFRAHSIGGDTAGRLNASQFGMLHNPEVRIGDLQQRIAECAMDADPQGKRHYCAHIGNRFYRPCHAAG
jgi:GGDEF domain-containing protein